jgi:plastocyanin
MMRRGVWLVVGASCAALCVAPAERPAAPSPVVGLTSGVSHLVARAQAVAAPVLQVVTGNRGQAAAAPAATGAQSATPAATTPHRRVSVIARKRRAATRRARRHSVAARAAGAHGITIIDFGYTPRSITIAAGDSVTWTNTGKAPHSATATDHSFDTGLLNRGRSASHTFARAGTYSYFCVVHPWMTGSVIVLAAGGSATTSSGGMATPSGSAQPAHATRHAATSRGSAATAGTMAADPAASTAGGSSGAGSLPYTGFVAFGGALLGLALAGLGAGLRRLAAR